ncbi:MAG: hypothetical protein JSS66_12160 [Armatimonadetes bacterium]|nr:hypothetical protein [Armatimonadota bacterium]
MIAALFALAAAPSLKILFIGNSHTANFDIANQVKNLLQSGKPAREVVVSTQIGAMLNTIADSNAVFQKIQNGHWDIVVLQGAQVSSSHKYKYPQDGAVTLAKASLKAGARVLLYVEWPRRGWDESEFTLDVYREIRAEAKGSEVVPVCNAWNMLLGRDKDWDLWAGDGNHTNLPGSYLASCVLATWIDGPAAKFTWEPKGIGDFGAIARETAVKVVKAAQPKS